LAFSACALSAPPSADSTDAAASRAAPSPLARIWRLDLSPTPGDLALAQISFHPSASGQAISGRTVRIAATDPFGDDYLALAAPVSRTGGWLRALVLVVNRTSPLADPVDVRLRLTTRRRDSGRAGL
jgi:hypothetical protein